jgi:molybdopterin synthase catalytic subunit
MLHAKIIDVSKEKIDILKAGKFLSSSSFGAIIYFVGTVRDINENKKVTGITYDTKDTMVIKSFEEIYKESETKLKIKDKAVFIEHVKGYVDVEEKSIIIAVGCRHRDEAYNLSRFIIEEIKKRTPIWKKEHYTNEESEWLKGVSIQL